MNKISLKHFALTGEFGLVKVGMTKQQVIQFLGKPDYEQDLSTGFTGLLYAWYELFFETKTEILWSIQNDHLQECENHHEMICFKNDKVEIDTWFLTINQDITRKQVKETLLKENISFTEEMYCNEKIIRFDSGVYLDFDNQDGWWVDGKHLTDVIIENEEDFVLNAIRYFPHLS